MEIDQKLKTELISKVKLLLQNTLADAKEIIDRYHGNAATPKHVFRPSVDEMSNGTFILWSFYNRHCCDWQIIDASFNGQVAASAFWGANSTEQEMLAETEHSLARFRTRLMVLQGVMELLQQPD